MKRGRLWPLRNEAERVVRVNLFHLAPAGVQGSRSEPSGTAQREGLRLAARKLKLERWRRWREEDQAGNEVGRERGEGLSAPLSLVDFQQAIIQISGERRGHSIDRDNSFTLSGWLLYGG